MCYAQYDQGSGATCWMCPVCGYTVSLTPEQLEGISPYTPCPACYSSYAAYFIQVPCSTSEYGEQEVSEGGAVSQTGSASSENSGEDLKKGSILMVLPPQQYREEELNIPREYFLSKGYSVVLASKGVRRATGMSGENASIDIDIRDVSVSDYLAVVFVGGEGIYSLNLNEDPDYQALARSASEQDRLIGAICLGPWILADAGLLRGRRATAAETDHLAGMGAEVSDEPVVRDGRIITGNGPDASQAFAEAVVSALEEADQGVSQEEMASALRVPLTSGQAGSERWRCTVCGYVYDPVENGGVPFEDLPSTWRCPCGAPKSKFIRA
ncbi:MAG: DJ-1/PfpI family protein [Methanothrix sp.]|nr:DJ-1/PfpI family protein [Methanothrix sp.]